MAERAVTEMQVFVTKDGKQHKTFEEAMEHHQQHVCAEAIGAWVKEHMPGRDLEVQTQVTVCINQHWRELYGILAQRLDRASGVVPEEMFSVLDRTLPSLGLPERVLVALQDGGHYVVGHVVRTRAKELLGLKAFGKARLQTLNEALHRLGLEVGMEVGRWTPPAAYENGD